MVKLLSIASKYKILTTKEGEGEKIKLLDGSSQQSTVWKSIFSSFQEIEGLITQYRLRVIVTKFNAVQME